MTDFADVPFFDYLGNIILFSLVSFVGGLLVMQFKKEYEDYGVDYE